MKIYILKKHKTKLNFQSLMNFYKRNNKKNKNICNIKKEILLINKHKIKQKNNNEVKLISS